MKKILKYSVMAFLCLSAVSLTGCKHEEYDTDQYAGAVALSAVAPNPVMRGGELRILGTNLENVSEIRFAGGVTVTNFTVTKSGDHGELRVMVPLEGPEVGKVAIVTKDGTVLESFADLEFTEPIELDSFAPAEVLSGDVVTVKGEYLNNVQEVILGGVYITEFVSKDRHELKFVVPYDAVTGYVIVGDVNEIADPNTIPNQIYSATELVVGDPTVNEAAKATYKSGEVITVTGAHLDMIQKVDLVGAAEVDFNVAEDGKSLSFTLPASATDGGITLTSYAGKTFTAGEIETVTVADLAIESLAEDGRYKAGSEVKITGSDLDLVTKVDFANATANSWYYSEGSIIATIPAEAQDGAITVTLDSGKQAFTPGIEVVKPVVLVCDSPDGVAGETVVKIYGNDLDLVTGVTIGDKVQGFIPCGFSSLAGPDGSIYLELTLPREAYTGPITVTAASGYTSETEPVTVTYNEAISVVFDAPSFALGKNISFTGSNLLKVESVAIKGNKVMDYLVREDNAMSFVIPEGMGPGVYRLEFTLIDGTTLTWPVPFEITAAYSETFIWEGYEDLAGWGNSPYLGAEDAFVTAGMAVGDVVRVYFQVLNPDWWQFQLHDGHWGNVSIEELGWDITVSKNNTDPSSGYFAFNVTQAVLDQLTSIQGWGGAFLCNGEGVALTGLSLIKFTASETVVWEGTSDHTGEYATNLTLGGEDDWVNAELWEGAEVRIYFTPDDWNDWSMQIFDGHWNGMGFVTPNGVQWNVENSPEAREKGYVSFKAEGDAFQLLTTKAYWGNAIILQGKNLVVTKVAFI